MDKMTPADELGAARVALCQAGVNHDKAVAAVTAANDVLQKATSEYRKAEEAYTEALRAFDKVVFARLKNESET